MAMRKIKKWFRSCWLVRMRRLYFHMPWDGRIAGEDIPADVNLILVGHRVMIDRGSGNKFGFSFRTALAGERFVTLQDIFPCPLGSAEDYHYSHKWGS
jgi:hypothetical protein